ncbi:uncharacterized protein GGS25DRAFT_86608 [Hypoxylon fragiforme]|uniref:uncharacterized protein n=1 Tax=Hypoxylon fragiforme TaxID=63214 RepID=UPI0020C72546|nr:uncharacterized protein GGS25DRAFT_86608 [Hypoxylon fragiforme]KAI2603267.1 hypothetical protein GGS25DRAFT_86608 [Hypoxylon fragiforme]
MPAIKSFVTKFGKGAATKQVYIYETWLRWVARGIQFILAIIVCGLYGSRVNRDHKDGNPQSVAWVYALIVAGLSSITCFVYAIPNPFSKFQSHRLFAWDLTLFVLWIALFGTFAVIFLKRDDDKYEGTSVALMKCAVWVDLVNALFWAGTGAYGCFRTFVGKKVNGKIDQYQTKIEDGLQSKVDQYAGPTVSKYAGPTVSKFSMNLNPLRRDMV